MTAQAWFMALLLAAFFGGLIGWSARVHTQGDRYIRSLAERHEGEASYWLTKLDNEIQEQKGNIQKENTHVR